jgi:hypothetical protein
VTTFEINDKQKNGSWSWAMSVLFTSPNFKSCQWKLFTLSLLRMLSSSFIFPKNWRKASSQIGNTCITWSTLWDPNTWQNWSKKSMRAGTPHKNVQTSIMIFWFLRSGGKSSTRSHSSLVSFFYSLIFDREKRKDSPPSPSECKEGSIFAKVRETWNTGVLTAQV